ncbi:F-box/WD repeat-containing protein 7 [Ceratocystis lukuohia]|uniref:F-box/WD repeat-containing protein 7 n=1 Tax=Ceratocystis lukuohia TaxID=2019550 RepID=A0ABR4MFF3_9PEZI
MSMTTNTDNFFQTDATHAKNARQLAKSSNVFGNPIKLKSKVLALISDPSAPFSSVFVAESASKVRRVDLETGSVSKSYSGPTAPVTCIAATKTIIAAGSWDKAIYQWDISTSKPVGKPLLGHTDFVKALTWAKIDGVDVLVSGGADRKLIVWNAQTGAQLHTIQDSAVAMGSLQHLVVDPVLTTASEAVVVSAGSDPHIRRWRIRLTSYEKIREQHHGTANSEERPTICVHETGVYRLHFATASGDDELDLWTASADGTAKCLSRTRNFTPDDVITHGDHVRAVAVTELWVITAGRDEDIKIWDKASGKLAYVLYGHYDEVTDLLLITDPRDLSQKVCSTSIDGTVRVWPLKRKELDQLVEEMHKDITTEAAEENQEENELLTAEEEAELAALMEDD